MENLPWWVKQSSITFFLIQDKLNRALNNWVLGTRYLYHTVVANQRENETIALQEQNKEYCVSMTIQSATTKEKYATLQCQTSLDLVTTVFSSFRMINYCWFPSIFGGQFVCFLCPTREPFSVRVACWPKVQGHLSKCFSWTLKQAVLGRLSPSYMVHLR